MSGPVAVVASRIRTEEKAIIAALVRRGVPHEQVDPRRFWAPALGADVLWPLALNREIGAVRACALATTLEAHRVRVVNSAEASRLCADKWRTTLAMRDAGLPVPDTSFALTPDAALDALDALGYPAVVKPLSGSWGRLVSLLPDRATAETVLEYVAALPAPQSHLVYVQRLVDDPGRDIRLLVVGGKVVGAAHRRADGLRTNVARGATSTAMEPSGELVKLAVAAAAAVGADIAGVDVMEDRSGAPHALEVNDRVEFAGLQAALGDRVDIAGEIVAFLLGAVR